MSKERLRIFEENSAAEVENSLNGFIDEEVQVLKELKIQSPINGKYFAAILYIPNEDM
jgi:hypothetical protein